MDSLGGLPWFALAFVLIAGLFALIPSQSTFVELAIVVGSVFLVGYLSNRYTELKRLRERDRHRDDR